MTEFSFLAPDKRLSLNDRIHWSVRARRNTTWKNTTRLHAVDHANRTRMIKPLGPSRVHVEFIVAQQRRRDADNAMASVKPILDGLVAAGWFVDDTVERVQPTVGFRVDRKEAGRVVVRVTELQGAA